MNEVVKNVVEQFNKDLSGIFGNRLLEIIIYGSSVRGGFCPDSSDIDFIVLIKSELSNDDQMKIQNLHTQYRKSKSIVSLFEGRYIGLENDKVTSGYYVGTNPKGWKPIHNLGFGDLESAMILDSYKAIYKTDLLNSLINFDWNVVYKEISFQLDEFLTNDLLLINEAYKKYALITAARSLYTYTMKGFISKLDVHDWIKNNYIDIDYGNPIMFLKNVKFEIESFKSSHI
ncbi:MAG: nucleotidyltransferase domain-containing protein [Firmicutes bacterium]|nr:nucleotidyltransferase domain-containing protein [Bacillota bacterium]